MYPCCDGGGSGSRGDFTGTDEIYLAIGGYIF